MSCEHGNPISACDLCDALDDAFKRGFESGKEPVTGVDHISDNCTECLQKSVTELQRENARLNSDVEERAEATQENYEVILKLREKIIWLERIIAESKEHCQCPACRDGVLHDSDCAVHNMPAMPNGKCNCGAIQDGMVAAPVEPTEKMIQAACLAQSLKKYDTYEEWRNDTSSGVSERIRNYIINDYKAMIEASKEKI